MQITARATVLAVALFVSAPLLAADSTQKTPKTEQDDCWLPTLPSTDLATGLAGFLPKPDRTAPDSAEIDRDLSRAASCVRPLGLWNEPVDGASSGRGSFANAAWPERASFLEGSYGADGLSAPAGTGARF